MNKAYTVLRKWRLWRGVDAPYHQVDWCHRHLIPRKHRVDIDKLVILCSKGDINMLGNDT